MSHNEIMQTVCGGIISLLFYSMFFVLFAWALVRGDFPFHYGRICGNGERVIGALGLLGITAGAYLAIGFLIFDAPPPLTSVAVFLFGLFFLTMLGVRFWSLFSRQSR